METYTVIGVWIDDELVVAGVAKGSILMLDCGAGPGEPQRYAETFVADSADHAEELAIEESQDQ